MALSLATPVQTHEPQACFTAGGKKLQADCHAASKGHREHAPAWRPLLLPWHSLTEGWRGRGKRHAGLQSCQSLVTWAQTKDRKKKKKLLSLVASCLLICLCVCQASRQLLSMSEYCLYTWTCTHTHTLREACALSVTLFSVDSLSLSSLFCFCYLICGCETPIDDLTLV